MYVLLRFDANIFIRRAHAEEFGNAALKVLEYVQFGHVLVCLVIFCRQGFIGLVLVWAFVEGVELCWEGAVTRSGIRMAQKTSSGHS